MVACRVEKMMCGSKKDCFGERAFQQRIKHLQGEIRENVVWTEKEVSRERRQS